MYKKLIATFWILYDLINIYILSGKNVIRSIPVEIIPGEEIEIRHGFYNYYLGSDNAPILFARFSVAGYFIISKIIRKDKNTILHYAVVFIFLLLINLILFRLRVVIEY